MRRDIRLFVSSTFLDMGRERDRLARFAFPELRRRCAERDISFCEVDLRWGITREEAEDGHVLKLCLGEIERCVPFQICLLGERYGWVDPHSLEKLQVLAPELARFSDRSVTELEIRHGILNADPSVTPICFFYFRSADHVDHPADRADPAGQETESPEHLAKLSKFKDEIRSSGHPLREGYRTAEELADWVLQDLSTAIDRLFPSDGPVSQAARERDRQARLLARSALGYVPNERLLTVLDRHATASGGPLLVEGSAGAGKSALLAHWLMTRLVDQSSTQLHIPETWWTRVRALLVQSIFRYRKPTHQVHQVSFFATATDDALAQTGMGWAVVLVRILEQLQQIGDIEEQIPSSIAELPRILGRWLGMAAAKSQIVLVLDGLDEILEPDQLGNFDWLPEILPEGVRLIVSVAPGQPATALSAKGWRRLRLRPLSESERLELMRRYLGEFGKRLSTRELDDLVRLEPASNPLFLRTILEQLRHAGGLPDLAGQLRNYLAANDLTEAFDRVLESLENAYDGPTPGLAKSALALLVSGRRGLTEAELLDLLGSAGEHLPIRRWSALGLALEPHLLRIEGVLTFVTRQLWSAAEKRYLSDQSRKRDFQRQLADYFHERRCTPRGAEELPWLLVSLESWDELYQLLVDPEFLTFTWQRSPFEVSTYWTILMTKTRHRPTDAYAAMVDAPDADNSLVNAIGQLFADLGFPEDALRVNEKQVTRFESQGDTVNLTAALSAQSAALLGANRFAEAKPIVERQLALCKAQGDTRRIASAMDNLALVNLHEGQANKALTLLTEAEKLHSANLDDRGLAVSLGNQAAALYRLDRVDDASALWRRQERLCRRLGDLRGLSSSLGNQARVLASRQELGDATRLHLEEERLCRQINDLAGLQISLGNQAHLQIARGNIDDALLATERREQIAFRLGDISGQIMAFCQRANVYDRIGETTVAGTYRQRALSLAKQHRDLTWPQEVQLSLNEAQQKLPLPE